MIASDAKAANKQRTLFKPRVPPHEFYNESIMHPPSPCQIILACRVDFGRAQSRKGRFT